MDLSLLSQFSFTGIVTYARSILPYLFRKLPDSEWILFTRSPEDIGFDVAQHPNVAIRTPRAMRSGWLWKTWGIAAETRKEGLDLLFMPSSRAPLIKSCAVITYIHDLGFRTQPEHLKRGTLAKTEFAVRHAVKTSDFLFAGSEFIQNEISSAYKVPAGKIGVTHYGYDPQQFHTEKLPEAEARAILLRYGIQKPYVLYLGVLQGRKNLVRLIDAAQIWQASHPDLQLVLAGKRGWNCEQIYDTAARFSSSKVHLPGPVAQEDLRVVYQEAECFVLPSLYEGFGIPVTEAMACGTPALLSNAAALPEAGGKAAAYFDPIHPEQIADCVLSVYQSAELHQRMTTQGLSHVKSFTWEQCAARTVSAFDRFLEFGSGN